MTNHRTLQNFHAVFTFNEYRLNLPPTANTTQGFRSLWCKAIARRCRDKDQFKVATHTPIVWCGIRTILRSTATGADPYHTPEYGYGFGSVPVL